MYDSKVLSISVTYMQYTKCILVVSTCEKVSVVKINVSYLCVMIFWWFIVVEYICVSYCTLQNALHLMIHIVCIAFGMKIMFIVDVNTLKPIELHCKSNDIIDNEIQNLLLLTKLCPDTRQKLRSFNNTLHKWF